MKILIIEDDPYLREPLSKALAMQGYQVLAAEDGCRAVEIFRDEPEVGLVLLDWTLPGMGGDQVFEVLRRLRPDVKVILTCGTIYDEVARRFAGRNVSKFLQKPFRLTDLIEAIRAAAGSDQTTKPV